MNTNEIMEKLNLLKGEFRTVIVKALEDILNTPEKKVDGEAILKGVETRIAEYYIKLGMDAFTSKLNSFLTKGK